MVRWEQIIKVNKNGGKSRTFVIKRQLNIFAQKSLMDGWMDGRMDGWMDGWMV